jgi:hypothetical protein
VISASSLTRQHLFRWVAGGRACDGMDNVRAIDRCRRDTDDTREVVADWRGDQQGFRAVPRAMERQRAESGRHLWNAQPLTHPSYCMGETFVLRLLMDNFGLKKVRVDSWRVDEGVLGIGYGKETSSEFNVRAECSENARDCRLPCQYYGTIFE